MSAAVAATALLAAAQGAAATSHDTDGELNTWNGGCSNVPAVARWPEQPLRFVPVDTLVVADLDGGTCTGELNGVRVENAPLRAEFELRGLQSCEHGVVEGRAIMRIAGVKLEGDASYRRGAIPAAVVIEGDEGGSVVAFLRGTTGAGPTDPTPLFDFAEECAGEGIRETGFVVVHGFTPTTFASRGDADD